MISLIFSGETMGVFLFSRAILSCEVVWVWLFLYIGTYTIQYAWPREPYMCYDSLGCLPEA